MDKNYFFESNVTITATSEDANFPASNLTVHGRSYVYRSKGAFIIDTTNNKINFKKVSGGVELTATIASGTSTSPGALATAIKTALEAADGVNTYTVTYSATTGLWTILSSGAFLSILFSTGTNASTSCRTVIGFGSLDYTGAVTYTGPTRAIHTEENIVIDLQTTDPVDSFALFFNPMTGSKYSSSAALRLQANATNVWTAPSVDQALTYDDDYGVFTHFFASAQSYRYWRLNIKDAANSKLYIEVPKLVLSSATQLTQMPEVGYEDGWDDQSKLEENNYGHLVGDIYPVRRLLKFSYVGLPEADQKTLMKIFKKVGAATPIALAADPTAVMFDKDKLVLYGRIRGGSKDRQRFTTFFDRDFSVLEAM